MAQARPHYSLLISRALGNPETFLNFRAVQRHEGTGTAEPEGARFLQPLYPETHSPLPWKAPPSRCSAAWLDPALGRFPSLSFCQLVHPSACLGICHSTVPEAKGTQLKKRSGSAGVGRRWVLVGFQAQSSPCQTTQASVLLGESSGIITPQVLDPES